MEGILWLMVLEPIRIACSCSEDDRRETHGINDVKNETHRSGLPTFVRLTHAGKLTKNNALGHPWRLAVFCIFFSEDVCAYGCKTERVLMLRERWGGWVGVG